MLNKKSTFFVLLFISASVRCDELKLLNHYAITIPVGYVMTETTPQFSDFDLIEVHRVSDESQRMGVYFGNYPSFPKYEWGESQTYIRNEDLQNKSYPYRKRDGTLEGLRIFSGLSYRNLESPYTRIHYFATGVRADSAAQFEKIISSIKVVNPNLD